MEPASPHPPYDFAPTPPAVQFESWVRDAIAGCFMVLRCSFCGKTAREVKKIVAGPTTFICDECIGLCSDVLAEEEAREGLA